MDAVDLEKMKRWHEVIRKACEAARAPGLVGEFAPFKDLIRLSRVEAEMRAMLDFEEWSHARQAGKTWHPSLDRVKASLRDFPSSETVPIELDSGVRPGETIEEWAVRCAAYLVGPDTPLPSKTP